MFDISYSHRFPCLSNPPDPDSFFPNLQRVAWYPENHLAMLPLFRLLCGPALTVLSAEFAVDPTSLAMLAALGTLCPNIVQISISASTIALSDDLANALSTSMCRWNDLKHVTCDDLSLSAMEHLSQARNLESLTACASGNMSPFSPPYAQRSPFSRLQQLHLYAGILSSATSCLRGLHLSIEQFRLDLFDSDDVFSSPSVLKDFLMILAEACSHVCLAKFYLCIIYPHFPSPGSVTTIHDARPLLSFANLRVVSFEGLSGFSFNDNAVAELASAWPYIEELVLSTYVNHAVASLPTFRSLFHLARVCPNLRVLAFVIDMTAADLPSSPDTAGRDVRSDILEDLCFGNSPIRSPITVAHMLHHLYPALKYLDLSVWDREPLDRLPQRDQYEVSWGMVNIELQHFQGGKNGIGKSRIFCCCYHL